MQEYIEPIGPQESRRPITIVTWIGIAVIAGLLFLYLAVLGNLGPLGIPDGTRHPAVGTPLSELELAPLTGAAEGVTLADLRGQVTLINFWGTWCPPCIEEFPALARLQAAQSDRDDFRFLSVSCGPPGQGEDPEKLKQHTQMFLSILKLDVPTYHDPRAVTRLAIMEDAGLGDINLPMTVLLDRQGTIRALWMGYAKGLEKKMESALEQALSRS